MSFHFCLQSLLLGLSPLVPKEMQSWQVEFKFHESDHSDSVCRPYTGVPSPPPPTREEAFMTQYVKNHQRIPVKYTPSPKPIFWSLHYLFSRFWCSYLYVVTEFQHSILTCSLNTNNWYFPMHTSISLCTPLFPSLLQQYSNTVSHPSTPSFYKYIICTYITNSIESRWQL